MRRRLCERRYLQTELPAIDSLEDIEACLQQITWTRDGFWHLYDSISYPEKVWAKKKDDCDGFAVLAAELLKRWNPDAHPMLVTAIVRPVKKSHTVCAFREGDSLSFFDNAAPNRESYPDYEEIVTLFTRKAERIVCWDVVDPDTLKTQEFHRVRRN